MVTHPAVIRAMQSRWVQILLLLFLLGALLTAIALIVAIIVW
jgi:hypothetical protein